MRKRDIVNRVSIKEILSRYWGEPNKIGRYRCCFHNGVDHNMSIKGGFAHCFVCGGSGGVVEIVMAIFGLRYKEALRKINEDFCLGLDKPLTVLDKIRFAERERELQKRKEKQEKDEQFEKDLFKAILTKIKCYEALEEKTRQGDKDMFEYAESNDFLNNRKACFEIERLDCLFNSLFSEDKKDIIKLVKKGKIKI